MADDNTLRAYRTNDPHRLAQSRPASHDSTPAGDPLAELARLIGQSDPFADAGPGHSRSSHPQAVQPAPALPAGDWRRSIEPPPDAGYPQPDHPRRAPPVDPAHDPRAGHDPYRHDQYQQEHYQHAQYQDEPYQADPHRRSEPQFAASEGYAEHQPLPAQPPFGRGHRDEGFAPRGSGQYGHEDYDDPPPRGRRSGLVTALTLIACAMLGTAGAYAYRTYYSDAVPSRTPVIVADRTPAKIVPPANDAQTNRNQERFGDPSAKERLVSREEQPVSLTPPGTQASPRVVLPAPVQPNAGANAAAPTTPQSGNNEPRRVRTVTIRPDGAESNDQPVGNPPPPPSARQNPEPKAVAPRAAPPPPPPAARTAPPPRQQAARSGPLSLDPSAPQQQQQQQPQQQRSLTPPAPRLAAAPPPDTRANATAAASGGYVVQVSSQRSEADARASFRALQAKYPRVLNGRQPIVKRADLGAKGIYYRAMVGPFASSSDASQFCNSLKAAGGQCIIQRN